MKLTKVVVTSQVSTGHAAIPSDLSVSLEATIEEKDKPVEVIEKCKQIIRKIVE